MLLKKTWAWFTTRIKNHLFIWQQSEYEFLVFFKWLLKNLVVIKVVETKVDWTLKIKMVVTIGLSLVSLLGFYFWFSLIPGGRLLVLGLVLLLIFQSWLVWLPVTYLLLPVDWAAKLVIVWRAKLKLKKINPVVIGISGSYGKSSTKFYLEQMLTTLKVQSTPGNINTLIGVARDIITNLKNDTKIYLVELGAYRCGDIRKVAKLVRPKIGVLTAINEAHLSKFGSIEKTFKAKYELLNSLPVDGLAVVNLDFFKPKLLSSPVKVKTFSKNKAADFSANEIKLTEEGLEFKCKLNGLLQSEVFTTKLLGSHQVDNILPGIVIGQYLKVPLVDIYQSLAKLKPLKHRLEIVSSSPVLVIDDSYNGNPAGVEAALEVLGLFKRKRKIYLTPGLVELGLESDKIHFEIGVKLAVVADVVVLIDNQATRQIKRGLLDQKYDHKKIIIYQTREVAHQALKTLLKPDDVILFQNDLTDIYL